MTVTLRASRASVFPFRSVVSAFSLLVFLTTAAPGHAAKGASAKASAGTPKFVIATRAHLRKQPTRKAAIVVTVSIATEVRQEKTRGAFARVRLASGERGWIARQNLVDTRPRLPDVLARFRAAPARSRARRSDIERATALAPGDLDVIDALQGELEARGDKKWMYYGRKGWIAAKRRTYRWDGPLYPVVDGVARIPAPCDERATANGKRRPAKIERLELRARAFPLASSGKMVSVTERGGTTQRLNSPGCAEHNLVYRLPSPTGLKRKKGTGALVSSWLVAGHTIVPFAKAAAGKTEGHATERFRANGYGVELRSRPVVDDDSSPVAWRFIETTFDGDVGTPWHPLPNAKGGRPVALFFDEHKIMRVLWFSSDTDGCTPASSVAWVTKVSPSTDGPFEDAAALARARTHVETGALWTSHAAAGCNVQTFTPLPGEPRDISHEKLESADWKQ